MAFSPRVAERNPFADAFDHSNRSMVRREAFYRRTLGPFRDPGVYHWEDNNDPHIDVYVHTRTRDRPYETLITGGMSDRAMPGLLPGSPVPRRVELILKMKRARTWAALVLRELASLPFEHGVVLTAGGLIEGSREVRPGSLLRHALLLPADEEERLSDFTVEGEPVSFLRPVFLTEEEFRFALANDPSRIARMIENAGEALLVNADRPPLFKA